MQDLNYGTVTQGGNGYPKDTYKVILPESVADMKDILTKVPGRVIMVKMRDGWSFYESKGDWDKESLLDMRADDQDSVIRYRPGCDIEKLASDLVCGNSFPVRALFEQHPDVTASEGVKILTSWKDRIEEITDEVSDPDESYDIWMNNPDPNYVDFTVDSQSVSYRSDVWTYHLAIVPEIQVD